MLEKAMQQSPRQRKVWYQDQKFPWNHPVWDLVPGVSLILIQRTLEFLNEVESKERYRLAEMWNVPWPLHFLPRHSCQLLHLWDWFSFSSTCLRCSIAFLVDMNGWLFTRFHSNDILSCRTFWKPKDKLYQAKKAKLVERVWMVVRPFLSLLAISSSDYYRYLVYL